MKWEEALTRSLELKGPYDGFYLSYKVSGPTPGRCPTCPETLVGNRGDSWALGTRQQDELPPGGTEPR